jgi:hypothetical protein
LFGLAVIVSAPLASADKAKTKTPTTTVTPAMSPRGDAALVLRARTVRELPTAIDAADRKTLVHVTTSLRLGKHAAGRAEFARWAKQQSSRLSADDTVLASLWVARESGVGSMQELADAADRVRFTNERVDALTTAVADLREAASSHATMFHVPVEQPYVLLAFGGEKRVEHVAREDLAARLQAVEAEYEKAVVESDKARAAFEVLEKKNRGLVDSMLSMVHSAAHG